MPELQGLLNKVYDEENRALRITGDHILAGEVTGLPSDTVIAPGVITDDHVAADAAIAASKIDLSGYEPRRDRLIVGAGLLGVAFGTPALGGVGSGDTIRTGWSFADATVGVVAGEVQLPAHWLTYKLSARWVRSTGSSANIVVQGSWGHSGDAEALSGTSGSLVTVATAANNTVKTTELGTSITADPTEPEKVTFARLGTDAADTFTGAIALLALILDRVT